ncbi:unnamed protein product [Arabidopsis lyrata]|nr:unnamed protein product [Arabidopsis lyrata]
MSVSIHVQGPPGSLTPEMDLISQKFPIHSKLMFLVAETMSLEPKPTKLISLVRKIFSLAISKNSKLKKLTSLCPHAQINNDYGSYSCINDGCSYVAHSKCATQSNVWDGVELEGEPQEVEDEEVEPFVTISDGIIQHFSHQHHHLRLDDNTTRDYDQNKMCQACIIPVYIGNFYSCMQCDFILHEECAKLSRKIHHPIHPHLLTLVGGYDGVMDYQIHVLLVLGCAKLVSSMSAAKKDVVLCYTCSAPQFLSR